MSGTTDKRLGSDAFIIIAAKQDSFVPPCKSLVNRGPLLTRVPSDEDYLLDDIATVTVGGKLTREGIRSYVDYLKTGLFSPSVSAVPPYFIHDSESQLEHLMEIHLVALRLQDPLGQDDAMAAILRSYEERTNEKLEVYFIQSRLRHSNIMAQRTDLRLRCRDLELTGHGPLFEEVLLRAVGLLDLPNVQMQHMIVPRVHEGIIYRYLYYLETGKIVPLWDSWAADSVSFPANAFNSYSEIYLLAVSIKDIKAQNDFIDAIRGECEDLTASSEGKWLPSKEELQNNYQQAALGDPIRQLMVDLHINSKGHKFDHLNDDGSLDEFLLEPVAAIKAKQEKPLLSKTMHEAIFALSA